MSTLEPFVATYTGGKLYPLGPDPEQIKIEDIAHSLSQQCRFIGHSSDFWSVAAHSIEVARRVEKVWRSQQGSGTYRAAKQEFLTALLHDASEAYIHDIAKPIKPLFLNYVEWEGFVQHAVAIRYGLVLPFPDIIHKIDKEIVKDEVAWFFSPGSEAWKRYGVTPEWARKRLEEDGVDLTPLDPKVGEARFLEEFERLGGKR